MTWRSESLGITQSAASGKKETGESQIYLLHPDFVRDLVVGLLLQFLCHICTQKPKPFVMRNSQEKRWNYPLWQIFPHSWSRGYMGRGFCWRLEFLSGGKPNPQWMVCFWDLHSHSFLLPSFHSSHGHTVGLHWRPYGPTVGLQLFHKPTVGLHWGKQYNKKRKVRPSAGWL